MAQSNKVKMKVPNAMFEFNVTDENTPVSDDYVNNQWASTTKISLGVKQQSHTHTCSNQRKVKLVFVASRISNYWLVCIQDNMSEWSDVSTCGQLFNEPALKSQLSTRLA